MWKGTNPGVARRCHCRRTQMNREDPPTSSGAHSLGRLNRVLRVRNRRPPPTVPPSLLRGQVGPARFSAARSVLSVAVHSASLGADVGAANAWRVADSLRFRSSSGPGGDRPGIGALDTVASATAGRRRAAPGGTWSAAAPRPRRVRANRRAPRPRGGRRLCRSEEVVCDARIR